MTIMKSNFSSNSVFFIRLGLGLCLVFALQIPSVQAEMTLRCYTVEKGELVVIGNTLGLSQELSANGPGTQDDIGTFISTDQNLIDDNPANATNPWFPGTTNDWTKNSSSAVLDIPADAQITYAELIWSGSYQYGLDDVTGDINSDIHLQYEDGSQDPPFSIVSFDPDSAVTLSEMSETGFPVNYYVRSGIVTDWLNTHGAGTYTAMGIPATQDHNINSLDAAGWNLVVIYSHPNSPAKTMQFFMGAKWVEGENHYDIEFNNLCCPPAEEPTGRLWLAALEGDANRSGDEVSIQDPSQTLFIKLSSPNNPVDNFFGAQINDSLGELDTSGTCGTRNHNIISNQNVSGARQGFDLTAVNLKGTAEHLANHQTTTTIRLNGLNDGFVAVLAALETSLAEPRWTLDQALDVNPTNLQLGQNATISIYLDNFYGTQDASNLMLTIPLAAGIDLNSFEVDEQVMD